MLYLSIACIVLSTLVAVGNIAGCIGAAKRRKEGIEGGYSNVPFVSVGLSIGGYFLGGSSVGPWAFAPALLDPGTWVLLAVPVAIVGSYKNKDKEVEP